jgi:L-fucose mutarotase/ribose pyranase (RbsD/FucU family)
MSTWQSHFASHLPRLGHRNWIIVADAAFPEQSAEGVSVIVADAPLDETLRTVLTAIHESGHVTPKVLLDRELGFLTDELCPGVSALRASIHFETGQLPTSEGAHEMILEKLNIEAADYSILVIKTNSMIPYTSIFLQLDCGYWDNDREAILRGMM